MLKEPVYCVDSWILNVFRDVREAITSEYNSQNIYIYINIISWKFYSKNITIIFFFFPPFRVTGYDKKKLSSSKQLSTIKLPWIVSNRSDVKGNRVMISMQFPWGVTSVEPEVGKRVGQSSAD